MADKERFTEIYSVYIQLQNKNFYIAVEDIENFYFIEDIFSYSIVGKIQFNDRNGILEFGPVTGNEKIGIIYGNENDIEREFDIFKMSKIMPSQTSIQVGTDNYMEVIFVDSMFYKLTQNEYSTSWSNTKYSQIVSNIAENALDISSFEEFEDSVESVENFHMPYWTSKQTIDWIMKRVTGSRSNRPGFLFYNSSLGSNFITLESLLQQSELMTVNDKDDGIYKFQSDKVTDFNKILSYRLSGIDNHAKKELKGGYGLGYDFSRKKFIRYEDKYSKGVNNFTLLGRKSLFPDISNKNTNTKFTAENSQQVVENIYQNEWIKRYSMQQTFTIIVEGHEERHAGGMIEIIWPSKDEKELFNKNMAGKYLIKSITHQFTSSRPPYRQKLILIKNAYEDSDNTELLDANIKNLGA